MIDNTIVNTLSCMKLKSLFRIVMLLAVAVLPVCSFAQQPSPQPAVYQQKMQFSALLFMENKGQVADEKGNPQTGILFSANSGGAKIYLTTNSIHYQFSKTEYPKGYDPFSKEPAKDLQQEEALRKQIKTSTHRFTVELQGSNLHPIVSKQGQSSYYENYYLAQCPDGITNVHGYEKIIYQNVYPNIDWVVYSKGGFMEYDFLVHPGGNPANIKLQIKDADKVSITPQGELLMKTSLGEVKEKAPVSYVDGRLVASRFKQNGDGTVGFAVQQQPGKELRIDPSIVWSTYYGGSGQDAGYSCSTDTNGDIYMSGMTASLNNIASGSLQYGNPGEHCFLSKFDNAGNRLWATYYGGNDKERGGFCTVDSNNNVYLSGTTSSTTGISFNGFQNIYGGGSNPAGDAFLAKFNSSGVRIWATYYGGYSADNGHQCVVDRLNNVYLCGWTQGSTNLALGGYQNTIGGSYDAFLVKFTSAGNRIWATYFGGPNTETGYSCAVDNNNDVYLTGETGSFSNISFNGFQNSFGGNAYDNYLVKFGENGNRLWATYSGGNEVESGPYCKVDRNNNVFLVARTGSANNMTTAGSFQNTYGGGIYDIYLTKYGSSGNRMWSTYFGGSGNEFGRSADIDANGNIYITGAAASANMAYNGFPDAFAGGSDVLAAKFDNSGNRIWSGFFGGNGYDEGYACTLVSGNYLYITGFAPSVTGIAYNGFQNTYGGSGDAFLTKIEDITCTTATQPAITAADTVCTGSSTTLSIASGSLNSATTWQWRKDSCNGATVGTGTSVTISPTTTTTYFVRGEGGCAAPGNCASKTIVVRTPVTPSVVLTASPAGVVTSGTAVTFTATPTNGGTAPVYTFRVNGNNIQNGSSNTFTSTTLLNNDIVTVLLTSNALCAVPAYQLSNALVMIIAAPCISPTTPTISTNYDTVCTGATPTLTIASGNLNSATHWQWYTDSCGGTPVGNTSSITFTPTATTTYYVRGEGGCITPGNCASKTIYVKPKPVVTFTALPVAICAGDTATITFTGTAPANAAYTWNWGSGNVVSGTGVGPYKVVYNAASSIGLTVNNGTCSVAATTQTINPTPAPELTFNVSDTIGCESLTVTFSAYSLNVTSWVWDFGDGITLNNTNTPVQHTYATGSYKASLTVRRENCATTAVKTITVYRKPTAAFSALSGINTPVAVSAASFSFTNTSQNASRYLWQFGDANTSYLADPTHRYNAAGMYAVKLYAYNTANCVDSFELKPIVIIADTLPAFSIPNAFSPNKDGINDTWMIKGLQENVTCKVNIYNRWGQTIFTSTGYSKPWDGTYNGKPLPVDIYYYVITISNKSYNGSVMLLR